MENGNNGKIISAVSMESLDNCSTISSIDQPSQVRTLFVSGLPIDTRPRELYLLFRGCTGYEASQLKITNKNGKASTPVGFVTFFTRNDADEAKRQLQGIRFDPESPQTLRLELARSNTKVTKPKQISPPIISPNLTNASAGMLPPPLVNPTAAGNYMSTATSQNAIAAAAAAAYAAAAQQAMSSVNGGLDNSAVASMLAMNGSNLMPLDQLSFLSAFSENHQLQQQQAAFQQLVPFVAASQAASFQMFTPLSVAGVGNGTPSAQQQQQAAIAAAMAQIQQQSQNHQQQNAMSAMATANNFLCLPPPPPHQPSVSQQQQAAALMAAAAAAVQNTPNGGGNQQSPCSTLFVANLGANVNEEEVRDLFKKFAGFSRLRMHTKGGSPVAFVEYHDVRQAALVLNSLQGFTLSSSERGSGIRIEFARSKMGEVPHNPNNNPSNNNSLSLNVSS